MRNTEELYEDNPNKYKDNTLRINRLKSKVALKVVWEDITGKAHTDYFTSDNSLDGIPDFHVWDFPEDGVRNFLTHCPIHTTWVEVWRNE